MHIVITNFNGNFNVGLYAVVTDSFVLLGKEVPEKHDKDISKALGLPIKRISIAGTGLLGVFCLWANNTLLIPHITFDHEKDALDKAKIPYTVIETDLTCLGNNIIASETCALINPDFTDDDLQQIHSALEVPVHKRTIMEVEAIGGIGIVKGNLGVFHRDIPPKMVRELEKLLGITITTGTINMGNPYIKSGLIVSEHGFVVGDASGGPEIQNIDEALGFIEV